ncbi:MAG TPA: MG2 domain-containing protein [Polyangiales bacterium]|nr:MG2 domain-containing protein [Polyangiales bacterium]
MITRTRSGWLSCLCALALSCSHSPHEDEAKRPVSTPDAKTRRDQASNGAVEIDESGLHAVTRGSEIELSIPVLGLKAGSGSVIAELIAVDHSSVKASATVDYELEKDERRNLSVRLALPDDVKQQADRVAYSVQVRDSSASLRVTRSLFYVLSPYDLRLEGPAALREDKPGSYRVRAQDPMTREPVADVPVSLDLKRGNETLRTLKGETDENGSAIFEVEVEEAGAYAIAASSEGDQQVLSGTINVAAAGQKILLTSDKPIYQPGQTMHLRAMALKNPGNAPLAKSALTFEVSDGKGNKVFKKQRTTDDYGIASVDFKLATLVNMGGYKLEVSGEGKAEKTVQVARYVLPKFELKVATEKPWYEPGRELTGTVDGRYFFSKPVGGADVTIQAMTLDAGSQVFQRVMGKTDDQGHWSFTIKLPEVLAGIPLQDGNALVTLRASMTDSAGQVVEKDTPVTVAAAGTRIALVPEASQLVVGLENRFHVFATDPLGTPVTDAELWISATNPPLTARTDAFGHAELRWKVENQSSPITVQLTTREGEKASGNFTFTAQTGLEHVLVRTDKSLYSLGESVKVQVLATRGEGRAYLDWLNDGQIVDMRTLELKDGVASLDVALDDKLAGENRIEAYVVDDGGNAVRAGRTIVVSREGGLKVSFSQDKSDYRPGEPAKLSFNVTDAEGKPAPAALGVQIVDEAVFGLIDARPGLLRTFFELEDSFAKPNYEIHVPPVNFEKLLFEDALASDPDQKRAAQAQAEAQLSALRGSRMMGLALTSWATTQSALPIKLMPFFTKERTRIVDVLKQPAQDAVTSLAAKGCNAQTAICNAKSFSEALIAEITRSTTLVDFWGNAYRSTPTFALTLTSSGPDERSGSSDDTPITIALSELGVTTVPTTSSNDARGFFGGAGSAASAPQQAAPPPPAAGLPGGGLPSAPNASNAPPAVTPPAMTAPTTGAAEAAADNDGPRVRSEFPETLYVNPALITDGEGKASVELNMADSITSWRVSALANAKNGGLGGGQAGVKVFQDFFVDIDFPAELTRGDQVEFPVVVYNYLKAEQTVRLELETANWYSALGSTTTSITLAPDQVKSARIPVRVEKVGTQTLTVRAFGTNASDAVARSVRVVPDGVPVEQARSGALQPAEGTSFTVSVPNNAVANSAQLYLDVYPAFTSQAVQGLDSMLRVPGGCFEQTTSTTWPNVLVTSYLEQTKQNTPEIQLKAESLISAGYQRLLTFEHQGGGYSWFGERDGQANVSVTAFGLMEFADMAKVAQVDQAMITRTQNWLASQQAADGSWMGAQTEFFTFQTSGLRNTAFVVWALADSGYKGQQLARGLEYVRTNAAGSMDTFTLALAANALAAAAPDDAALPPLLDRLEEAKQGDAAKSYWPSGTQQTTFYSAGRDSDIATTALIAHALIRTNSHAPTATSALQYIISAKDAAGNFGSTQASIWSLKALMLAASRGNEGAEGALNVSVDGQTFKTIQLEKDQWDVNTRLDMSTLATSGNHQVALAFEGKGQVSYNLVNSHYMPWALAPRPALSTMSVGVSYDRTSLVVDETVTATLRVENLTRGTQNMLLVSVGIPPGFELASEDLDAYVRNRTISQYERTAKQLILYITALPANAKQELKYRLKATMPVRAQDGGSLVYLYYQPEQRAQGAASTLVVTGS